MAAARCPSWVSPSSQKPATGAASAALARSGTLPAWAQVAAAVLVFAAGAAIANVQVRYGSDGLTVTTGWMAPAAVRAAARAAGPRSSRRPTEDWRPALDALEQRSAQRDRADDAHVATAPVPRERARVRAADAAAVLRRVQAMLDASEQRQRQELACGSRSSTRESTCSGAPIS